MRVSVSTARGQLGQLCARAQDPREGIIWTWHGHDIAAVVSVQEVKRIWAMQDDDWFGRCPIKDLALWRCHFDNIGKF